MTDPTGGRGAASPVVVFLCLLLLLGGIAGVVIWTGQIDAEPIPPTGVPSASPAPSPDTTLTDEEAIARFKHLDALRVAALEERDLDVVSDAVTRGGPVHRRLRRSIKQLRTQGVVVDEQWRLRQVTVVRNEPSFVELRIVAYSDAQFFDEGGDEVTLTSVAERRVVACVLRRQQSEDWLLHDCVIERATPLERG